MTLLDEAKKKFKKGDFFLSATKNLSIPIKVNILIMATKYPNTVINEDGGVIVTEVDGELVWATKVEFNQ